MDLAYFESIYHQISHFDRHLGMSLAVLAPGRIRYHLTVGREHLSASCACHGGVIAGMMDAVLGVTALSWAVTHHKLCATVEFKIHYFAPVAEGDRLEGSGEIDFTGTKLVVVSGTINDLSSGQAVAKGIGTFTLYPLTKKAQLAALLAGRPEAQDSNS